MATYTFIKRSGAPAGTITVEVGNSEYIIDDSTHPTIVTSNADEAAGLRGIAFLQLQGVVAGAYAPLVGNELQVWQHRAALLDPAAYVMLQHTQASGDPVPNILGTVPTGKTWYMLNAFWLLTGGRTITDLGVTVNSGAITSSQAAFSSADLGKNIEVPSLSGAINTNADSSGNNIKTVTDASNATLAFNQTAATQGSLTARIGTHLFLRNCDALTGAVPLPAGTVIEGSSQYNRNSWAYVCQPELVVDANPNYQDPKALYYSRLLQLRTLPTSDLSCAVPFGSAVGTVRSTLFPTDFASGFVTLASVMDAAWVGLGLAPTINLTDEISDSHIQRTAKMVNVPFQRSAFTGIQMRGASVSGNATDVSVTGKAAVRYTKLPGTW